MKRLHLGAAAVVVLLMAPACGGNDNSAVGDTRPDAAATGRANSVTNERDNVPNNTAGRDGQERDRRDQGATGTSGDLERNAEAVAEAGRDGTITMQIQAKFASDDVVKGTGIDVDTQDGVVTLKGTVESRIERDNAERIARETDGVKRVVNDLRVAGREANR